MMKKRYKIGLLVVGLLAVAFYVFQLPQDVSSKRLLAGENDDQLPMTTGGLIDYLEIANRGLKENITVDNNVVVDIVQAFGTEHYLPNDIVEQFLSLLGDPEIPNDGFYRDVFSSAKENTDGEFDVDQIAVRIDKCYGAPWKVEEYPLVGEWLTEFDSHLDQFVRASKKPRYFHPLCQENGVVIGALLPYCQVMRETAHGLSLRAMNQLERGNVKECLRDLTAIRRLGKLMEQGGTLIENLVGYAMIGIAFESEKSVLQELANGAELANEDIEAYRKVIRETSDLALLSETMGRCEKFFMLDCIQRLRRGQGDDYYDAFGIEQNAWLSKTSSVLSGLTDWNVTTENCEQFSERIIDALAIENDVDRNVALKEIESELEAKSNRKSKVSTTVLRLVAGAKSRGDLASDILLGMFTPAIIQVDNARVRTSSYDLTDLGFALELYRREHNQFPKTLNELAPQFIRAVPLDRFAGVPVNFNMQVDGYRIWSIGANRMDEQKDAQGNLIQWETEVDGDLQPCSDDVFVDVSIMGWRDSRRTGH